VAFKCNNTFKARIVSYRMLINQCFNDTAAVIDWHCHICRITEEGWSGG